MQFCTQQRSKCQILLSMSVISPKLHFLGFFLLIYLFLFLLLLSSAIFLRVVLIWLFLMNEGNGKLDWKWKHNLLCLTHRSWINSNFQLVATSFLGLHVLCWLAYFCSCRLPFDFVYFYFLFKCKLDYVLLKENMPKYFIL